METQTAQTEKNIFQREWLFWMILLLPFIYIIFISEGSIAATAQCYGLLAKTRIQ